MPVLKDFRPTKTLTLPSFPESRVEVYDSLLVGEVAVLSGADTENKILFGLRMLPHYIKAWNFTDEAGVVLPIDEKNLGFLKEDDVVFLLNEIAAFAVEGKKKDASTPPSVSG